MPNSIRRFLIPLKSLFTCSFVLLAITFLLPLLGVSQQFGGNSSSIKWRQVNTDTARIIFAEGMEDAGKRVATIIHSLQRSDTTSLGNRLQKINIVLQHQSLVPNAYVGLGPYRSEFYLVPPQNSFDLGAMNWVDHLSLHEYRHVQQYSNFNVGLARVMRVLFGQQGQDLANSAAIPNYFFEGDAVFNETVFSRQGRGRTPYFFNGFHSLLHDKKDYSFMKLRNGSLKHFVPDHYSLGYLLVSYGREKYGEEIWKSVSQDAARFKPLFYSWQGAIKRHTGVGYRQFVADAFSHYNRQWQNSGKEQKTFINKPTPNARTDYKYPYLLPGGELLVLKRGYKHVPGIYKMSVDGREEKLATRDIAYDDYFSYNNGRIVYATLNPDTRWGNRETTDIVMMDVNSGQRQKITRGKKHFSPDVSHNGAMVAVVNMNSNQSSEVEVVDTDGRSIFRSPARRGIIHTYPKFSSDDSSIYTLSRNEDGKMAVLKFDIISSKETILVPYGHRVFAFPSVVGDTLYFSSSYKGSDEVWAYTNSNNELYRVAADATGLYHPAFDASRRLMYAANFTSTGYKIVAIARNQQLWQKVKEDELALPNLYVPNALKQENNNTIHDIDMRSFPVSRYRKSFGLFNFHSWRPSYDEAEYSFTVFGENVLNTFQSELSYTYNTNETSHRAGFTGIYGGWFIQPVGGVSHTWNRTINYNADTSFHYDELNLNAGLRLPLNLSSGRQYRYLTLASTFNHQQVNWTGIGKSLLRSQNVNYLEGRVLYTGQVQQALQHIYPRWAQSFLVQYRKAIGDVEANQLLLNGTLYLPALMNTHNLVISASYQRRDTMNQYFFTNNFPFSRGYSAVDFPEMWRVGFNYHLPLLYPDFGVANIVFFQRIRANGFYDVSCGKSLRTGTEFPFSGTGAEVFFDTKWWNQQPVTFGIRYTRLLDRELNRLTQVNQWEFILPVNLLN